MTPTVRLCLAAPAHSPPPIPTVLRHHPHVETTRQAKTHRNGNRSTRAARVVRPSAAPRTETAREQFTGFTGWVALRAHTRRQTVGSVADCHGLSLFVQNAVSLARWHLARCLGQTATTCDIAGSLARYLTGRRVA